MDHSSMQWLRNLAGADANAAEACAQPDKADKPMSREKRTSRSATSLFSTMTAHAAPQSKLARCFEERMEPVLMDGNDGSRVEIGMQRRASVRAVSIRRITIFVVIRANG
jgi:hypothetical protein